MFCNLTQHPCVFLKSLFERKVIHSSKVRVDILTGINRFVKVLKVVSLVVWWWHFNGAFYYWYLFIDYNIQSKAKFKKSI